MMIGDFFVVVPQVATGGNRRAAILPVRYRVFQYIHDFGPRRRLAFVSAPAPSVSFSSVRFLLLSQEKPRSLYNMKCLLDVNAVKGISHRPGRCKKK